MSGSSNGSGPRLGQFRFCLRIANASQQLLRVGCLWVGRMVLERHFELARGFGEISLLSQDAREIHPRLRHGLRV